MRSALHKALISIVSAVLLAACGAGSTPTGEANPPTGADAPDSTTIAEDATAGEDTSAGTDTAAAEDAADPGTPDVPTTGEDAGDGGETPEVDVPVDVESQDIGEPDTAPPPDDTGEDVAAPEDTEEDVFEPEDAGEDVAAPDDAGEDVEAPEDVSVPEDLGEDAGDPPVDDVADVEAPPEDIQVADDPGTPPEDVPAEVEEPMDVALEDVPPLEDGTGAEDTSVEEDTSAGVPGMPEPTPYDPADDAERLLQLLNHAGTTKSVLTSEVGLTGKTPGTIIAFRAGSDGLLGTSDDQLFASLADLDSLPSVGETSIAKLTAFARNWRPELTDPLLVMLNAPSLLASALVDDGVGPAAAQAIVLHRSGPDGEPGTADDVFFGTRADVLAVSGVGPAAVLTLEAAAGLGSLELLSSGTASDLVAVAFDVLDEALIVGSPVGDAAHVLLYTPFSEDAYTTGDDPYQFIDLSTQVPGAMFAAAFDPTGTLGVIGGESDGLYLYDVLQGEVSFIPFPELVAINAVAFSTSGDVIYAASIESAVVMAIDVATQEITTYSDLGANALLAGAAEGALLVSDQGVVLELATDGSVADIGVPTAESLFDIARAASDPIAVGDLGVAAIRHDSGWFRVATRTVGALYGAAVAPDGTYALLVGQGGTVLRVDLGTWSVGPVTAPLKVDLSEVGFASDGTAIIVGDDGTAILYTP